MGVLTKLKTRAEAQVAAASKGWPARGLEVVMVSGQDGSQLTIAYLASMLRLAGEQLGIITQRQVEIAGEQASGSDQADVLADAFRLQALFAQMKQAGCRYVLIELPTVLPVHHFAGLKPALLVVRRCGDTYLAQAGNTQHVARLRKVLGLRPRAVAWNRDDPCFDMLKPYVRGEGLSITFGTHENAECQMRRVELHPKGSAVELLIDHQTEVQLASHLTGKQAIYSMVAAASAAYELRVPIPAIEDGALALGAQPGSLQSVVVDRPYQVVVDSSVTPEGVAETLETLKHFARNRVVCVVSPNLAHQAAWLPVIGDIVASMADRIVVTDGDYSASDDPMQLRSELLQGILAAGGEARTEEIPDREHALTKLLSIARRNDIVAVLGSTRRPYYLHGDDRVVWSDEAKIKELLAV